MQLLIGPFRTIDLLICGIITAIIGVVAIIARGALSFPFFIAGWVILLVIGVISLILLLFILTIARYWFGGKEGFLFAVSRATGIPIYLDTEVGTNNSEFVLGEKENPKDIAFKDTTSGIKVDPSLLSAHANPMFFPKGLAVFSYSYFNYMPQSPTQHAAFKAIELYFHENCPLLSFLTVKEFVELISEPEHYLQHDALTKLNKYFKVAEKKEEFVDADGITKVRTKMTRNDRNEQVPVMTFVRQFYDEEQRKWVEQDMDIPEMMQALANARKEISKLPVYTGPLSGVEAFINNSVPYSSQHLQHVLMLHSEKAQLDDKSKDRIMWYAIAAAIVFIAGGLAYYIINMAPKVAGG